MLDMALPGTRLSGSWADRLQPRRREVLEKRYPADVLETMLEIGQSVSHIRPQPHPRPGPNDVAVLGSDAWFHLCTAGGRPQCDRRVRYPNERSDWNHHGERPGAAPRPWRFTLDPSVSVAPWSVSPTQRCPEFSTTLWPGHENPRTRLGRIRIELGNRFGRMCQACGIDYGSRIDHDHRTGLVRGLLCRVCNTWIDTCLHIENCHWADYLNYPPAEHPKLQYPK